MTTNTNAAEQKKESGNPFDIFIVGLRKGLNIGLYSLLPNVLMAFVLTQILRLFGVMDFLGHTCGGIMASLICRAKQLRCFSQRGSPAAPVSVWLRALPLTVPLLRTTSRFSRPASF